MKCERCGFTVREGIPCGSCGARQHISEENRKNSISHQFESRPDESQVPKYVLARVVDVKREESK